MNTVAILDMIPPKLFSCFRSGFFPTDHCGTSIGCLVQCLFHGACRAQRFLNVRSYSSLAEKQPPQSWPLRSIACAAILRMRQILYNREQLLATIDLSVPMTNIDQRKCPHKKIPPARQTILLRFTSATRARRWKQRRTLNGLRSGRRYFRQRAQCAKREY